MAGKGDGGGHPRMTADYPTGSSTHPEEQKGLKESAQEMASRAVETGGQMKEKAREFASGMQGKAEESWRSARESMGESYSHLTQRAGDFWDDATAIVRRYPVASLAIAFGLGCMATLACSLGSHRSDMTERMSCSSR